jgi:response regulator RpfG family c-di-GMP phosphodiesterase
MSAMAAELSQTKVALQDLRTLLTRSSKEHVDSLGNAQNTAIHVLAEITAVRDGVTGSHQCRIQAYTHALAGELRDSSPYVSQIDREFLDNIGLSCHLHDLGKVGIPDTILLKPGALVTEERRQMKLHAEIGAHILDRAFHMSPNNRYLAVAAVIARFHHERWDGTGYPLGLGGEEIPLAARIVSVADVFDAITSERPYRPAQTPWAARAIIEAEAGRQFDPIIVEAFSRCFPKFVAIHRGFIASGVADDGPPDSPPLAPLSPFVPQTQPQLS